MTTQTRHTPGFISRAPNCTDGDVKLCPLHEAAPELLEKLKHHHSVTNANDFEQTGYLHDPKPCPTCQLIAKLEPKS